MSRQLADDGEQLGFQDELALFVLLGRLVGLVVLPADCLAAASTHDVPHDVAPRCHVTFVGLGTADVDNDVEEIGLTMLAAKVLETTRTCQLPAFASNGVTRMGSLAFGDSGESVVFGLDWASG